MALSYVEGDATAPLGNDPKIIAHIVNTQGGWGAGFVLALSRRWRTPENAYRQWFRAKTHPRARGEFALGNLQCVPVQPDLWVANMVAQEGYGPGNRGQHRTAAADDTPPIRYPALRSCLTELAETALEKGASVHMPRIGCQLAGGRWGLVEPILQETLIKAGVPVTVYDFPGGTFNL